MTDSKLSKLLDIKGFPSLEKTWKALNYEEWVKRSFITALLDPYTFTQPFTSLLKEKKVVAKQNEWIENNLLVSKTLLPVTRLAHHFSGQLGTKNKIICYMMNPKLDVHSLYEFKRILFMDDELVKYNSHQIRDRLNNLQTNAEERKNLVDFFWKDELNKYQKKTRFIQQLKNRKIKPPSWASLYKIVGAAMKIKGINYDKNNVWEKAHENVVTIDLIPYFSSYWDFQSSEEMLPYLNQALRGIELIRNDSQTIIFFGAVYRDLFKDISQGEKIDCFPYQIEELTHLIDNKQIVLQKIMLNDPSGKIFFQKHNMYCIVQKQRTIPDEVIKVVQNSS